MNRLLQPGNEYDVLGLAPDARPEDIEVAYRWLIRDKGYRVDVPLRYWPQRRREIKAAYATLRDPMKRRAYDRSSGPVIGLLWADEGSDAATEALVLPATGTTLPGPVADRFESASGAPKPSAPTGGAAAPAVVRQADDSTEVREGSSSTIMKSSADEPTEGVRQPQEWDTPQTDDEFVALAGERAAQRGAYWRSFHRLPVPMTGLTAATTVVVALCAILFAYWPSATWQVPGSTRSRPAPSIEGNGTATSLQGQSQLIDPYRTPEEELRPVEGARAPADVTAAAASLTQLSDSGSAARNRPATAQGADGPTTTERHSQSPAAVASNDPLPSARPPEPNLTDSLRTGSPAPTAAPRTPAGTANEATVATAAPRLVATLQGVGGAVTSPPALIGGGPSDSDNRRGRYQGAVVVQFTVGSDGRADSCAPVRSSGNPKLDVLTCRLLVERARFTPARDAQGRFVASEAHATYVWGRGRRVKK